MSNSDEAEQVKGAATAWHQESDAPDAAASIVASMVELVPGTTYASLTVRQPGDYRTLGSTSPVAAALDEAQYELGEGPCVDAADGAGVTGGSPWLRSGDVGADHRWPAWGPRAAEAGVNSVLAVRLLAGDEAVGALNLYGESRGLFTDHDDIDFAVVLATHAALALASVTLVSGLRTAVGSRHVIGIAQGILMERFALEQDASFALLRRLSSTANTKLRVIAEQLVATRELPAGALGDPAEPADDVVA